MKALLCSLFLAVACIAGAVETSSYVVGKGDVLEITVFQQPELCGGYQIAEDGTITYPLVGQVHVEGRSVAEIAAVLERLLERDYFVDVQIHVEVSTYASRPVTVLGEVRSPGTFFLKGRTTLIEIIAEAGGLTSAAGPEIELRRVVADADAEEPAKVVVMTFETEAVMTGEEGQDEKLRSGDVISVTARRQFFITGEINRPGQYDISSGLTLMQAISQAGGQSKFASKEIELHREVDGKKVIATYDVGAIRKGRADDPSIKAGDVIIVRRRFF